LDANAIQRPSSEIEGKPDQSLPDVIRAPCFVIRDPSARAESYSIKALRLKKKQKNNIALLCSLVRISFVSMLNRVIGQSSLFFYAEKARIQRRSGR
jgi:hypothetical protein